MDIETAVKSVNNYLRSSSRRLFGANSNDTYQPEQRSKVAMMLYRAFISDKNFSSYRPVWKRYVTFGKTI